MPQLALKTQPRYPSLAAYRPIKAIIDESAALASAPWANEPGPTDAEIEQMAEWYAAQQFGAFAVESDSLDKEISNA